jgi:ketosteroid isomerase-like protein
VTGLALVLGLSLALASPAPPATSVAAEAQVRAAVDRLAVAFRDADVETLGSLIGPRYVHTNTGGGVVDRERWLAYVGSRRDELRTGVLALSRYENRDVEVRVHGATAIVTGVNVSAGTRNGTPFARELRFTQVWVLADGDWKRVAFHDTEVLR